jgi:O-antigen ligase
MNALRAILKGSLVVVISTALDFLWPEINRVVSPVLVLLLVIDFVRRGNMRWLYMGGIVLLFFPELQTTIYGPIELHHALLALVALVVGYRIVRKQEALQRWPLTLTAYGGLLAVLTYFSRETVTSWHRLFVLAFLFLIAILAPYVLKTLTHVREFFIVLLVTNGAASLIGLAALYWSAATSTHFENPYLHMSVTEGVPRIAGTLLDSNFLGHHLLLVLPALFGLLATSYQKLSRRSLYCWTSLTILLSAIFLMTYSRSSYLGLGAALLVLVVWLPVRRWWRAVAVMVVAAVIASALYWPFPFYSLYRTPSSLVPTATKEIIFNGFNPRALAEEYIARVQNNPNLSDEERDQLLARDVSSDSLGYRIIFWKSALRMFKDHPIIGVGAGQFRYQFKNYQNLEFIREPDTHNIYLEQLAETGTVGSLALFGVLSWAFYILWRAKKRLDSMWRLPVAAVAASVAGILVQSALLGGLGVPPLYIALGLVGVLHRQLKLK